MNHEVEFNGEGETENDDMPFYSEIKKGLMRHCHDCAKPSQTKYNQYLNTLEQYHQIRQNIDVYKKS